MTPLEMMNMIGRDARRVAAAACLALVAAEASAIDGQVSLEAGVGYSDNVARTDGGVVDETLGTIGLAADLSREDSRLTGSLVGELQFVTYLDDTFDDAVYGRVDLDGAYEIVPGVFSWVLEDSWGQARRDEFATPSPANEENINYLATGPDLRIRLAERTNAKLSGRYALTTYADTPRDYTSVGGDLGLDHGLSQNSTLGLALRGARVEYDDSRAGSDYDVQEVALTFKAQGARTELTAEAGTTTLRDQGQTLDNPLFRLTIDRKVATASTLTVRIGQEFTDSGRWFRDSGSLAPGGPDAGNPSDVLGSGGPFENRHVGIGWATTKPRTRFSVGLVVRQEDYVENSDLDRDVFEINAYVSRRMTQTLTFSAQANFEREEFDDGSLDDDRLWTNVGLTWDVASRTFLRLNWQHNSDDSNATARTFSENVYWLRVGFRPR